MSKELKQEMQELALEGFESLKESGVEWVQWLCSGLDDDCEVCRADDGKIVRLQDVKVPWHQDCTEEYCKCSLIAVAGPDEGDPGD